MLTTWKQLVKGVLPRPRHYAHGSEADAATHCGMYGDHKEADVTSARICRLVVWQVTCWVSRELPPAGCEIRHGLTVRCSQWHGRKEPRAVPYSSYQWCNSLLNDTDKTALGHG